MIIYLSRLNLETVVGYLAFTQKSAVTYFPGDLFTPPTLHHVVN